MKPIAYINVEKRTLEFAKKIFWHTPTVANLDRIPLFTKEALAQPEFTKHEVENADDWSEWVCPDAKGYLMKCCDCGLVHEAEFGVVRYKSETEREACDFVDDPNLQAVFRMRRSEQWSPEDTAHRAGGLPMAQPEQEPVATLFGSLPVYDTTTPQRTWVGLTDEEISKLWNEWKDAVCLDHKTWAKAIEAELKEKNT
jgi:hypothetical protein